VTDRPLTDQQLQVLEWLWTIDYASVKLIAYHLGHRNSQAASHILNRLQSRGLVERRPAGTWGLTDEGRRIAGEAIVDDARTGVTD
jgi:Mn-dependent DtxR family transcriptional regulator